MSVLRHTLLALALVVLTGWAVEGKSYSTREAVKEVKRALTKGQIDALFNIFTEADKDNNTDLDRSELKAKYGWSDAMLNYVMKKYDGKVNGIKDGLISFPELALIYQ